MYILEMYCYIDLYNIYSGGMMKINRYSYYRNYKGGLKKIKLPNVVDRERKRIEVATCWRWFGPMLVGLFLFLLLVVSILLQWRIAWTQLLLFILGVCSLVYANEQYIVWMKI